MAKYSKVATGRGLTRPSAKDVTALKGRTRGRLASAAILRGATQSLLAVAGFSLGRREVAWLATGFDYMDYVEAAKAAPAVIALAALQVWPGLRPLLCRPPKRSRGGEIRPGRSGLGLSAPISAADVRWPGEITL